MKIPQNAKWLLPALAALAAVLLLLRLAPAGVTLGVGRRLPETRMQDLDGNTFFFANTRGQVLLIAFWATWCEYCLEELPYLERLQREYAADGLTVAAVLEDVNNLDLARDIRARNSLTYPILLDERRRLSGAFRVRGLPFSAIADKSGKIRFVHVGFNVQDLQTYSEEIRQLLEER